MKLLKSAKMLLKLESFMTWVVEARLTWLSLKRTKLTTREVIGFIIEKLKKAAMLLISPEDARVRPYLAVKNSYPLVVQEVPMEIDS